jgi:hypothetical protein
MYYVIQSEMLDDSVEFGRDLPWSWTYIENLSERPNYTLEERPRPISATAPIDGMKSPFPISVHQGTSQAFQCGGFVKMPMQLFLD